MKKIIILSLLLNIVFISCSRDPNRKIIDITTNSLKTTINNKGAFVNFIDVKNGKDYISKDTIVSVMSIRIDNQISKSSVAAPKIGENTMQISEEFSL